MLNKLRKYSDAVLIMILAFCIYLMILIILQYIPYNTDVGFLRIKQSYISISTWRWAFFVHVYSSLFVLLAGFSQFNVSLRLNRPSLHRKLGYIYVLNVLCITGPASLIMGFYANGGPTSQIAFVLLSVLWLFFTAKALIKAKQNQFTSHRNFMIRSYALTLSAITLRGWKYLISNTTDIHPMHIYQIVAWLGWGLNLIVAEYYIRHVLNNKLVKK